MTELEIALAYGAALLALNEAGETEVATKLVEAMVANGKQLKDAVSRCCELERNERDWFEVSWGDGYGQQLRYSPELTEDEDGTWTRTFWVSRYVVRQVGLRELLYQLRVERQGYTASHAGASFQNPARIRRVDGGLLISESGGLDI